MLRRLLPAVFVGLVVLVCLGLVFVTSGSDYVLIGGCVVVSHSTPLSVVGVVPAQNVSVATCSSVVGRDSQNSTVVGSSSNVSNWVIGPHWVIGGGSWVVDDGVHPVLIVERPYGSAGILDVNGNNVNTVFQFDVGDVVSIFDNVSNGFVLDHWLVNGSSFGNANPLVFNISSDTAVSAFYSAVDR